MSCFHHAGNASQDVVEAIWDAAMLCSISRRRLIVPCAHDSMHQLIVVWSCLSEAKLYCKQQQCASHRLPQRSGTVHTRKGGEVLACHCCSCTSNNHSPILGPSLECMCCIALCLCAVLCRAVRHSSVDHRCGTLKTLMMRCLSWWSGLANALLYLSCCHVIALSAPRLTSCLVNF